ncbi:hypothetical protein MFIFM68171_09048 [Madurella fahalii]|uniref:Uncharacterized protein n=1 Tax=Madurella fahalii TaxID=1157608 RepID=A0ABQ0GM55_9PEZI
MTRQYFCWKVRLTFGCGCVEYTQTQHVCGPFREGCRTWMTMKRTDKPCEVHRGRNRALNHYDGHLHHISPFPPPPPPPSSSSSSSLSSAPVSSSLLKGEAREGLGTYVLLDSAALEQREGLLPTQNKKTEKKSQGGVGVGPGGDGLEGDTRVPGRTRAEEGYWIHCQPRVREDGRWQGEVWKEVVPFGEEGEEMGEGHVRGRRRAEEGAQAEGSWEGYYLARRRI